MRNSGIKANYLDEALDKYPTIVKKNSANIKRLDHVTKTKHCWEQVKLIYEKLE